MPNWPWSKKKKDKEKEEKEAEEKKKAEEEAEAAKKKADEEEEKKKADDAEKKDGADDKKDKPDEAADGSKPAAGDAPAPAAAEVGGAAAPAAAASSTAEQPPAAAASGESASLRASVSQPPPATHTVSQPQHGLAGSVGQPTPAGSMAPQRSVSEMGSVEAGMRPSPLNRPKVVMGGAPGGVHHVMAPGATPMVVQPGAAPPPAGHIRQVSGQAAAVMPGQLPPGATRVVVPANRPATKVYIQTPAGSAGIPTPRSDTAEAAPPIAAGGAMAARPVVVMRQSAPSSHPQSPPEHPPAHQAGAAVPPHAAGTPGFPAAAQQHSGNTPPQLPPTVAGGGGDAAATPSPSPQRPGGAVPVVAHAQQQQQQPAPPQVIPQRPANASPVKVVVAGGAAQPQAQPAAAKAPAAVPSPRAATDDDDGPEFVEDDDDEDVVGSPAKPDPPAAATSGFGAADDDDESASFASESTPKPASKPPSVQRRTPDRGSKATPTTISRQSTESRRSADRASSKAGSSTAAAAAPSSSPKKAPAGKQRVAPATAGGAKRRTAAGAPVGTPPRAPVKKTASANESRDTIVEHQVQQSNSLRESPISPDPPPAVDHARDPQLKVWARERFARLLCPQQYYGRVDRVHNVRPLVNRGRPVAANHIMAAYALREASEVMQIGERRSFANVVNDGSHKFVTQLQLDPKTSRRTAEGNQRITTYALCELPVHRVKYAETEREGREVIDSCSAVFVADSSSYLASDLSAVRVSALLDVTWTLFADDEPPTCAQHRTPLQLFEPESRTLVCALCTANDTDRAECVVLSDMFSGSSLRSIQHSLSDRLDAVNQRLSAHVASHRAAAAHSDRRRHAVELQFSLVQAALDAKKAELLGILADEERLRDQHAARGVFSENEVRRHVSAALSHCREIATAGDDATPPFAQMATVVSSLGHTYQSNEPIPTSHGNQTGDVDAQLRVNLEHVVRAITEVSFDAAAAADVSGATKPSMAAAGQHSSRQPYRSPPRASPARARQIESVRSPFDTARRPNSASPQRRGASPVRQQRPSRPKAAARRTASATARPGARAASPPQRSPAYHNTSASTALSAPVYPPSTAPNGSLLFDTPLHVMIRSAPPTGVIEWKLRIDDPGTWVGLGVGVGDNFAALCNSRTCDTRHLWIAPTNVPRHVKLRVAIGPHKHCKLTIHDALGRQLDDNRLPHWNASKEAYPQVSFGEVPGTVVMFEPPSVLAHPTPLRYF